MKRKKRLSIIVLLVVMVFATMPMTSYAKGKSVYKDVTLKKVDKLSYDAIAYVKAYGGWKGLVKKNKFYPNKFMTRREFLIALHNLYGGRVTATIDDMIHANDKITSQYVCQKMVSMSKGLGYQITWNGNNSKMKRKDVARYIKIFATYNSRLAPRK